MRLENPDDGQRPTLHVQLPIDVLHVAADSMDAQSELSSDDLRRAPKTDQSANVPFTVSEINATFTIRRTAVS